MTTKNLKIFKELNKKNNQERKLKSLNAIKSKRAIAAKQQELDDSRLSRAGIEGFSADAIIDEVKKEFASDNTLKLQDISDLEEENKRIALEYGKLKQQLEERNNELELIQTTSKEMEKQITHEYEKKLAQRDTKIQGLAEIAENSKDTIEEKDGNIAKLKKQIEDMASDIAELTASNKDLKASVKTQKVELSKLKTLNKALKSELESEIKP